MIEMGKTYKTRDGREVRIYAVDGVDDYPVHGAVYVGGWFPFKWRSDGTYGHSPKHVHDLIEVKPRIKRTVWINVNPDGRCLLWNSREAADERTTKDRIACVKVEIDCEHGEGL